MVDALFQKEIAICYGVILVLTVVGLFTDKIPI